MATLFDLAQAYLNQGMPSISPIFQPLPTTQPAPDQGIVNTVNPAVQQVLNSAGGGEGINVYGTNLNNPNIRTRKDYVNPFPFTGEDLPEAGDYINEPTGLAGLYDKYQSLPKGSKAALGATSLFTGGAIIPAALGVYGLGKTLGGMLPVNRSGILSNELIGAGFALDNTGRVVAAPGKYNTPEGIMAGYNLTAREIDFDDPDNVFDRRDTNIRNTLKDKYSMTDDQIDSVLAEIEETGEYTGPFGYNPTLGKTTNLFSNLFNINKARGIVKSRQDAANLITERKKKQREEEKQKKLQDRQARKDQRTIDAAYDRFSRGDDSAYSSGAAGIQRDSAGREVGYNDPFDPGGGE